MSWRQHECGPCRLEFEVFLRQVGCPVRTGCMGDELSKGLEGIRRLEYEFGSQKRDVIYSYESSTALAFASF